MSAHEIERRVQQDPHDVDEVPVKPATLTESPSAQARRARTPPCEHAEPADAARDVQGMKAGGHEVEGEEQLAPCGTGSSSPRRKSGPGKSSSCHSWRYSMPLTARKARPSSTVAASRRAATTRARGLDRQRDAQAAREQQGRVERCRARRRCAGSPRQSLRATARGRRRRSRPARRRTASRSR